MKNVSIHTVARRARERRCALRGPAPPRRPPAPRRRCSSLAFFFIFFTPWSSAKHDVRIQQFFDTPKAGRPCSMPPKQGDPVHNDDDLAAGLQTAAADFDTPPSSTVLPGPLAVFLRPLRRVNYG